MHERVEPMPDAPEGTCVKLEEWCGCWAVRGRSGWFRCNANTLYCECSDFLVQTRRGIALTPCEHLRTLARHLEPEAVNPAIHTKVNGGMQAFCEERMAEQREAVTAMEPLSWTDAELRRIFS